MYIYVFDMWTRWNIFLEYFSTSNFAVVVDRNWKTVLLVFFFAFYINFSFSRRTANNIESHDDYKIVSALKWNRQKQKWEKKVRKKKRQNSCKLPRLSSFDAKKFHHVPNANVVLRVSMRRIERRNGKKKKKVERNWESQSNVILCFIASSWSLGASRNFEICTFFHSVTFNIDIIELSCCS